MNDTSRQKKVILRSATIAGPPTSKKPKVNQDRVIGKVIGETLIILLADGAGSKSLSHEGAEIAVNEGVRIIEETLNGPSPESIYTEIFAKDVMEKIGSTIFSYDNPREMGCTIYFGVSDGYRYSIAGVGDSFALIKGNGQDIQYLTETKTSEYANITELITSKSYAVNFLSGSHEDGVEYMALGSDGLIFSTIEKGTPLPSLWKAISDDMVTDSDLEALLGHLDSIDKITDDTTLVIGTFTDGDI